MASSKDVAPSDGLAEFAKRDGSPQVSRQEETELFWEVSDCERERQKASDGVWLNAGGESWPSQEARDGEAASGMDEARLETQDPQS